LLAFNPAIARSECVTEPESTPESTCVVYSLNGVRGVWFALETANALRQLRLELPEVRFQISHFESILELQEERINFYRQANTVHTETIQILHGQIDEGVQREEDLRKKINAWWRSPALWLSIGILITSVAYVAIVTSD
jgi:hypothetical protein